ncbi:abcA8 [Symbiodinium microadriaticum]|nr:abcA8 [Symbiodinium microadriaticum]
MAGIEIRNLSKTYRIAEREEGVIGAIKGLFKRRYREVHALKGISFDVAPGELVGFIGPNGAGKSTTIKIMSAILTPTDGHVSIGGLDPFDDRIAHVGRLGVVFGQRTQLWWDLPVIESFHMLRDIYRVPQDRFEAISAQLIDLMGIGHLLDQPTRQLSLGQRMRCDIAAAMLHEPEILFLDEPTIGLDATSKVRVREFVKRLNREIGVTVILTTHDMHDIEAVADRVIVIGNGEILRDGAFADLKSEFEGERQVVLELANGDEVSGLPGGLKLIEQNGRRAVMSLTGGLSVPAAVAWLSDHLNVTDLQIMSPPIEEIIARFYDAHGASDQLQYRAAALAGIGTQLWWGAMLTMIMAAFYALGDGERPMSLPQVISYIWLGQALIHLIPWNADPDIAAMMRSGDVAHERLRPLDTYWFWYVRGLGLVLPRVMMRATPIVIIAGILLPLAGLGDWSLKPPADGMAALGFAVALFFQVLLAGTTIMLINIITVAHVSGAGAASMFNALIIVGGGMVVPLPLFPDWMQGFLFLQPFAALGDLTRQIYAGSLTGVEIWQEVVQYRANAVASAGVAIFWGGMIAMVVTAFYEMGAMGQDAMPLAIMMTYVWLARVSVEMFPHGDPDILAMMREGHVAHDRLRPLDNYGFWAAKAAGLQGTRLLMSGSIVFLFTAALLPLLGLEDWALKMPESGAALGLFAVSMLLQFGMVVAVLMIMNAFTVMHIAGYGIIGMVRALTYIGAGAIIPLPLYPDWMQGFLMLQPFATMGDIPIRIYTGLIAGSDALPFLGLQLFWLVVFVWIGRVMMARVLWGRYAVTSIKSDMQYPTAFLLMMGGNLFINIIEFIGIWALFDRFGALGGWQFAHVCVFYGVINVAYPIAELMARGFNYFGDEYVRTGVFDRLLLRPRSLMVQLMGDRLDLKRFGRMAQGGFVLAYGLMALDTGIDPLGVLMMLLAMAGGVALFIGLWVIGATMAFWTVQGLEIINTVTYGGAYAAGYPISIYRDWFQKFFTFVVPLATISYFPLVGALGLNEEQGVSLWLSLIAPFSGFLFLMLTMLIFGRGVRHYQSTGS